MDYGEGGARVSWPPSQILFGGTPPVPPTSSLAYVMCLWYTDVRNSQSIVFGLITLIVNKRDFTENIFLAVINNV